MLQGTRDLKHAGVILKTLNAELTFKNGEVLRVTASARSADSCVEVKYSGANSPVKTRCKSAKLGFLEFWLRGMSLSMGAQLALTYSGEYDGGG